MHTAPPSLADNAPAAPAAPPSRAYVPESIATEADDDAPASLALEYREPPIDRLPPPLAEYVAKSAEAIGCDPCLVAMPALAACAAAIGDSRVLEVKPGFEVPAVLWTLVAAASGQLKTPAMKAAMLGLESAQRAAAEKHRSALAHYKTALAKWSEAGSKGAKPEEPKMTHYYTGDATLESLWPILSDNPRGLLQKRDELSGWLGGFGRYSEGKSDGEVSQWLELYDASAVKNDRKSGETKNIYLPRAPVSATGTIQVPILRNLLSDGDAKHFDNGLAPRFMMTMPPERPRRWSEAVTPPALVKQYDSLIQDLLTLSPTVQAETGRRDPVRLRWSPDAKRRWVDFYNTNGKEMAAFKSDRLKSAWSKLEGQAARLALVFHCVRQACLPGPEDESRVSLDTLDAALTWIDWLKNETRRIYYTLTHAGEVRQADKLIQFARRCGGRCTAREAARVGAGGRTAEEVETIMRGLVNAGLAEWETPEQPKGGRPTRYFRLKAPPTSETV